MADLVLQLKALFNNVSTLNRTSELHVALHASSVFDKV